MASRGRGKKAKNLARLQGVWRDGGSNSLEDVNARAIIEFWGKSKESQKDFLQDAILFKLEAIEDGYYRPAENMNMVRFDQMLKQLQTIVKKLQSIDFTSARNQLPLEHQHVINDIQSQVYQVTGNTDIIAGETVEFDDDIDGGF